MIAFVASFLGTLVGGTLLISFLTWLLGKMSGASSSTDPSERMAVAFILASALTGWGFWEDGLPTIFLLVPFIANACAELIVRALIKQRQIAEVDFELFD